MRLLAAIQGDLNALLAAELRNAERAVNAGVRAVTDGLKTELWRQITDAGLGTRLANTWRGEVYPRGQSSIGAAGYVWSKAPGLVRMYAEGAVIRSKQGLFLASRRRPPAGSAITGRRSRPAAGSASTACGSGSSFAAAVRACWSPTTPG